MVDRATITKATLLRNTAENCRSRTFFATRCRGVAPKRDVLRPPQMAALRSGKGRALAIMPMVSRMRVHRGGQQHIGS